MNSIRKLILLICMTLATMSAQAQIFDDFSDGDFSSNPTWIGMTDSFSVSSGQVRSTAGTSNSGQSLHLFTPSSQVFYSWEFYFRLAFNPSSQNYAEFWLSCDNSNPGLAENGYFVRIGGNTGDGIGLFKIEAGVESTLIDPSGNTLVGGTNNFGHIRVSRTAAGNWSIFEKITSAQFLPFGTATDNLSLGSQGVGIRIQTTKSNRTKHYFDDIRADLLPTADTVPPELFSLVVIPPRQLELSFSEDLDSLYSSNVNNYTHNLVLPIDSAYRLSSNHRKIRLVLPDTFPLGINSVQVLSSKDTAGNIQPLVQGLVFEYNPPQPAPWRSVVINEIYADETPSLGLPNGEFLELFNPGASAVFLQGWSISDAGSAQSLPAYSLPPGGHLILCSPADTAEYKLLGPAMGISLPSLNNTGDSIRLRDPFGNLVDEVNYGLSWYQDPSKSGGGYSLEQINPLLKCAGSQNWIASMAGIGGTPGQPNSVFSMMADTLPPRLDSLSAENPERLLLTFNEAITTSVLSLNSFSLSGGLSILSFSFLDSRHIQLNLSAAMQPATVYNLICNGIRDCDGNQAGSLQRELLYLPPIPLAYRQLQINEIFADESPGLGILPLREYLEIHNHGSSLVQLEGIRLVVGSTQVILPPYVMPAGSFLTICDSDSLGRFAEFGPALGINLPVLNNSGAEIRLLDVTEKEIDKVLYSLDWYDDPSKKDGGYSLEQVNPDLICSSKANWRASVEGIGGTPGQGNSVLASQPDVQAPVLLSSERTGPGSLRLLFNEVLNTTPMLPGDFEISGGNSVSQVRYQNPNNESITINFSNAFQAGQLYTLKVRNLKDCAGNVRSLLEIPIGIGRSPGRFELLITEVQADDSPQNALPAAEYLEIFNNSSALLDLAGVKLSDGSSTATLPSRLLAPGSYLVLCGSTSAAKFSSTAGIQVQGITSFPSLNLEGENLSLSSDRAGLIHRFHFRSSRFSPYSSWEKGWSLEMIDFNNPCNEADNWAISMAAEGGTPGKENSVKADKPDLEAPQLLRLSLPDSNHIRISWTEQLDSLSLENIAISLSGDFSVAGREINPEDYSVLTVLLNRSLAQNTSVTLTVEGAQDCAGNLAGKESLTVARPVPPRPGSWLLSEILFDPLSGGSDFVEIRNVSSAYLDLKEIRLANSTEEVDLSSESRLLEPGAFALFTESTALTLRDYPRGKKEHFIEINLPTFGTDTGNVRLVDLSGIELERFSYSAGYHAPVLDEVKGVSLERISAGLPAMLADSWQSASADAGYGTPGYENSNDRDFDLSGNFKAEPSIISPNGDGNADFCLLSYELQETGFYGNLRIYSSQGVLVKELAQSVNLAARGFWKWDGRNEAGRNSGQGLYLAVLELSKQGEMSRYLRIPVAIAEDR